MIEPPEFYQWHYRKFYRHKKVQMLVARHGVEAGNTYRTLLDVCWDNGGTLPDDVDLVAHMADRLCPGAGQQVRTFWTHVRELFQPDDGCDGEGILFQKQCVDGMVDVLTQMIVNTLNIKKRYKRFKNGYDYAKLEERTKHVLYLINLRAKYDPTYDRNAIQDKIIQDKRKEYKTEKDPPKPPKGQEEYTSEFLKFWNEYPRKKAKRSAYRAYKQAKNRASADEILAGVRVARSSPDWTKNGGQFIPYPATWLNASGWEDEETKIETENISFNSLEELEAWEKEQRRKGTISS